MIYGTDDCMQLCQTYKHTSEIDMIVKIVGYLVSIFKIIDCQLIDNNYKSLQYILKNPELEI
mgnify:CR=1 FL=1